MAKKTQDAQELSKNLKEISIAEFFEKNRHLLGYENTTKSMLTVIKELVDNSIDACEEAGILPDIKVTVKPTEDNKYMIRVEDNGPGIVEEKLHLAFGKFLYGSKFHRLRQARGTQGIGVAGAILYSQLTTGKTAKLTSSTGKDIIELDMTIDVVRNQPNIISTKKEKNLKGWHGIKIELEIEGRYVEKGQSIPEYLKQTAIMNPYAKIIYNGPNGKTVFERATKEMPNLPKEIKPHPHGVELGILRRMARTSKDLNMSVFLRKNFCRVGSSSADQILKLAKIENKTKPSELRHQDIVNLHNSMQKVKLIAPSTDCLSQLGESLIEKGLKKEIQGEHFVSIARSPTVYKGRPFAVEVGLAYGGDLNAKNSAELLRFANKVPLMYHNGDCAITDAVKSLDWRRYGLQQSQGSMPNGPLLILVHFASVWVPFTSEGKQAIASYPEIIKEIKLALQDAGRKLKIFISKKKRNKEIEMRQNMFERYIPEVAESLSKLSGEKKEKIIKGLEGFLKKEEKGEKK
ncbi:MAG: DNA topoisomerase VI subunit B [Candidatus Aenigmarchaeota archaeon]|nr:DNA topoisomerase VI subunit B [Candidatus Aenigmarchaeota archaeon]